MAAVRPSFPGASPFLAGARKLTAPLLPLPIAPTGAGSIPLRLHIADLRQPLRRRRRRNLHPHLVPQPQAEWRLRLISPRPSSSGGAFCFKSPLTAFTKLDVDAVAWALASRAIGFNALVPQTSS